ncbi:DUF6838 family protein [Paenibacillus yanchengensis]|uniref:DUF6838 family protein n=1 Tax=Paenibacillus yanchengensis TaxID=2035833 RepID=A0ABW4YP04_9BACL
MASTTIWNMYEAVKSQLRQQFPEEPIVEDEIVSASTSEAVDAVAGFRMRFEQVTVEQELKSRYKHVYAFIIYYSLPQSVLEGSSTVATAKLYEVAEQLVQGLERLELATHVLHGRAIQIEVKEGTLQFRITYSNYSWRDNNYADTMGQLQQEGGKMKDA